MTVVTHVQVRHDVRRPVSETTFHAVEAVETEHYLRVRGTWRGHSEERTYTLPWASIAACRWMGAAR